ncbi:MAG: phosphatase PAP2 family protein [Pirellulaceae bacterium]|jgi:membrane-associated phospholipid phosphatase|nr:phosphatase PAP2 family protein [Pirellulaceae bacterium]
MNSEKLTTTPRQKFLKVLAWVVLPTLGFCLVGVAMFPFDFWLSENLSGSNLPGDLARCVQLSEFFAHGFGIVVILVAAWILDPSRRVGIGRVAVAVLLTALAVFLLKNSVIRLRPVTIRDHGLQLDSSFFFDADSPVLNRVRNRRLDSDLQSMPSGHSASVTALAVGLCYLYPRGRWLFVLMACLGCFQRIAFLAHWPSDVFVSVGLGYFLSSAVMIYTARIGTKVGSNSLLE